MTAFLVEFSTLNHAVKTLETWILKWEPKTKHTIIRCICLFEKHIKFYLVIWIDMSRVHLSIFEYTRQVRLNRSLHMLLDMQQWRATMVPSARIGAHTYRYSSWLSLESSAGKSSSPFLKISKILRTQSPEILLSWLLTLMEGKICLHLSSQD